MKTIILARHGENDVMAKRLAGRLPGVHLNAAGERQAMRLAECLAGAGIQVLFSSPLERAVETAQPLAELLCLPIRTLDGLNELDYGHWQNRTYKDLARTRLWKQVLDRPSGVRFPGGESLAEAQQRCLAAVEKVLAALQPGQTALCVTHGDVIRLVTAACLQMPLDDYQRLAADPASRTVIQWGDDGQPPRVLRVNQPVE